MLNSENKSVLAGIGRPHAIEAVMETPVAFVGVTGESGATFIPSVSEDGIISWTNDKELENPTPVNIKGRKGEDGEKGVGIEDIITIGDVGGYTAIDIILTDGRTEQVQIPNGRDGIGINNIFTEKNDDGRLVLVIQYNDTDDTLQRIVLPIYDTGITSLVQTTGDSETAVMSQKTVTKNLAERSNAVKAVVSGEAITIEDGMPFENPMQIKVSGVDDLTSVKVKVSSKNLLPYPYRTPTFTKSGVTVTNNGDGSVTVDGTASATAYFNFKLMDDEVPFHLTKGKYTFKFLEERNEYLQAFISFSNSNAGSTMYINTSHTFTVKEDTDCAVSFVMLSGGTFDNVVIYPQIEKGDKATDYVQYKATVEYTPNENGVIADAMSVVPTTLISTDTEGATLEVEYYKDINKAFENTNEEIKNINTEIKGKSNVPKVIDDFQSTNGWNAVTLGSNTASLQADTTDFLYGSQSVRFTGCIQKHNLGIKVAEGELRIKFKINSIDDRATFVLMVSDDSNFTNFTSWTLFDAGIIEHRDTNLTVKVGEWAEMVLPWSGLENISVLEKVSIFNTLRFRFVNGNGDANVQMIMAQPTKEPRGLLTITFDDGCKAQYTKAAKILGARGLKATAYIIHDIVGVSDGCVTEDELISLKYDYGWDIQGHWSEAMDGYTEEQLKTSFQSVKDWIKEHGLGDCEHFAYANGMHNYPIEKIARNYFKTARTIAGSQTKGITSTKITNPYRLASISSVSDTSNMSGFNAILERITRISKYGGWLILTFHDIGDTAKAMFCSEAGFARLLDHAISCGVDIKTMAEAMRGIL